MTLLLILMDGQTYLLHRSDLPAEQLAAQISAGDWSAAAWQSQWINELPRQVTRLDGLVIVSVAQPGQVLAESAPALPEIYFSPRQQQVLDCLMDGLTAKEIASRLKLSRSTLDEYLAQIKHKLESRTIAQTVGRAVALGYWRPRSTGG
jgi:DNA-binding NarL/FixJ family response regulator